MFPPEGTLTLGKTSRLEDLLRRGCEHIFMYNCSGCANMVSREVNTGENFGLCLKKSRIALRKYYGLMVLPQGKEFHPQVEAGLYEIGGILELGYDRKIVPLRFTSKALCGGPQGPLHDKNGGRGASSTRVSSSCGTFGFHAGVHGGHADRSCGSLVGQ
jgi:hypothetical protein